MSKLRVLIVHNRYRRSGGEDVVAATEAAVLRAFGHEVEEYEESNHESFGAADLANLYWSSGACHRLEKVIKSFQPDVAHCHNVFYRITPSVYWTFRKSGVPIIQTLHNFRLGCTNARLSRDGVPCELCLNEKLSFWPGVYHSCFQDSALRSFVLGSSIRFHRLIGSLSIVDAYIGLSRFAIEKHIKYGIPRHKLALKPNCVYPDLGFTKDSGRDFCLFAGRLETDKGIKVLIEAARLLPPGIGIRIAGTGPFEREVREAAAALPNVRYDGQLPHDEVLHLMRAARGFVFPSLAYENFPMTIAEAFCLGVPVLASDRGTAAEIIQHGHTGLLFEPGSAPALAACLTQLLGDDTARDGMRTAARSVYETKYSGEATYEQLLRIYRNVGHPAAANRICGGSLDPSVPESQEGEGQQYQTKGD